MEQQIDTLVLGAGIVGVSVALHLQRRGRHCLLLDRARPGCGTSYGNAGLIQDEAIMPYLFPRAISELVRYARNRSIDASYRVNALPGLAAPFYHYWRNSEDESANAIAQLRAPLIRRSIADHLELAEEADATDLLRPTGWTKVFRTPERFQLAVTEAERQRDQYGVSFEAIDGKAVAGHEPGLSRDLAGAVHYPTPRAVSDPLALVQAYVALFERRGGRALTGDGETLEKTNAGWRVQSEIGPLTAPEVVICLGPWSGALFRRLGYAIPFFVMRGYHQHFGRRAGPQLGHPILDAENGYFLVPMRQGIRLTTGAEFARRDAPAHPVQLERALPAARSLLPGLGEPVEREPWLGARPCLPDMLPVIGPAPGHSGAWLAFGHAHHGLTLGPTTGRLLAQMMAGERPFTDPRPYGIERFL